MPGLQASRNAVQNLIAAIVAKRPPTLEPVRPDALPIADADLDDDQRHAVAVALSSPDLSLISGYPGSGKSRVIGEILRQGIRQAKRILFVAPTGAPLDRVIDRSRDLAPNILRCLTGDEVTTSLGVAVSLQERIRHSTNRPSRRRGKGSKRRNVNSRRSRLTRTPGRASAPSPANSTPSRRGGSPSRSNVSRSPPSSSGSGPPRRPIRRLQNGPNAGRNMPRPTGGSTPRSS